MKEYNVLLCITMGVEGAIVAESEDGVLALAGLSAALEAAFATEGCSLRGVVVDKITVFVSNGVLHDFATVLALDTLVRDFPGVFALRNAFGPSSSRLLF